MLWCVLLFRPTYLDASYKYESIFALEPHHVLDIQIYWEFNQPLHPPEPWIERTTKFILWNSPTEAQFLQQSTLFFCQMLIH